MGRFILLLVVVMVLYLTAGAWVAIRPDVWSALGATFIFVVGTLVLTRGAFRLLWEPVVGRYPAQAPAPDAVSRDFQSFSLGMLNMGCCVSASVDDSYLHLRPMKLVRVMGATATSIPWGAMEPVGSSGRVVLLEGVKLVGPKWCLELVG